MNHFKTFKNNRKKFLLGTLLITTLGVTAPWFVSCSTIDALIDKDKTTLLKPLIIKLNSEVSKPDENNDFIERFYSNINEYKNKILKSQEWKDNAKNLVEGLGVNNLSIPFSSINFFQQEKKFTFTLFLNKYYLKGKVEFKRETKFTNDKKIASEYVPIEDIEIIKQINDVSLEDWIFNYVKRRNMIQSIPGMLEKKDIKLIKKEVKENDQIDVSFWLRRNYSYSPNTADIEMTISFKPKPKNLENKKEFVVKGEDVSKKGLANKSDCSTSVSIIFSDTY